MSVPLIVDTDFSTDVGDLGALAIACAYHKLGHAQLLGVSVNSKDIYAPAAVDVVQNYFGLGIASQIGAYKGSAGSAGNNALFTKYLNDNFTHTLGLASTVTDAVTVYRTLLAARTSADVTIASIGYLTVLADLLASTADGISPLSGSALVAASVKRLVVMGGQYPTCPTAEFNFTGAAANASTVVANWPTPIYFLGYELGPAVFNGTSLQTAVSTSNPVRMGYHNATRDSGRAAWDEHALVMAVEGPGTFRLTQGSNSVNSSTGVNTFTAGAGSHYWSRRSIKASQMQARMNDLVTASPSSPYVSAWSSHALVNTLVTA